MQVHYGHKNDRQIKLKNIDWVSYCLIQLGEDGCVTAAFLYLLSFLS